MKPELFKWSEVLYGMLAGAFLLTADHVLKHYLKTNFEVLQFLGAFITAASIVLLLFNICVILNQLINKTRK